MPATTHLISLSERRLPQSSDPPHVALLLVPRGYEQGDFIGGGLFEFEHSLIHLRVGATMTVGAYPWILRLPVPGVIAIRT